jgi:hypothetical protein
MRICQNVLRTACLRLPEIARPSRHRATGDRFCLVELLDFYEIDIEIPPSKAVAEIFKLKESDAKPRGQTVRFFNACALLASNQLFLN